MKTSSSRSRASRPPRRVTTRAIRKTETRDRILKSAVRITRREGLRAASVPRVMRGVGLTVGGFYAHFSSKAALDVEILRATLGAASGRWLGGLEDSAGLDWVQRAVRRYLSAMHRDHAEGCAFPAVMAEISGAPAEVRQTFVDAFEQHVRAFDAHVPAVSGITTRDRALATMALTIGGLLLARATQGYPVSEELLAACRKWALPELDIPEPDKRNAGR
jgi:TetR/AcrR family transcriptional regulator, transcriptional repressor for nem operon